MDTANEAPATWDPFDRKVSSGLPDIAAANAGVQKAVARYQARPNLPRRNFWICVAMDAALFAVFSLYFWRTENPASVFALIALLPVIPCSYYYGILASMQADYMRLTLAKEFGWIYRSGSELLDEELSVSPELQLRKGVAKNLDSQFWGALQHGNLSVPVWMGMVSTPQAKDSRRTQYAVLRLPKNIACDLSVVSRAFKNEPVSDYAVHTESTDFNKFFYVEPAGSAKSQDVFQVLTPPVLDAVVTLRLAVGKFRLTFYDGKAVFIFDSPLFVPKYSNLLHSVTLDPRDLEALQDKKTKLADLLFLAVSQAN